MIEQSSTILPSLGPPKISAADTRKARPLNHSILFPMATMLEGATPILATMLVEVTPILAMASEAATPILATTITTALVVASSTLATGALEAATMAPGPGGASPTTDGTESAAAASIPVEAATAGQITGATVGPTTTGSEKRNTC